MAAHGKQATKLHCQERAEQKGDCVDVTKKARTDKSKDNKSNWLLEG